MTGRERILRALNHEEPDRVPLDIGGANACGIMLSAYSKLVGHCGIRVSPKVREFAEQLAWMDEEVCEFLGVDTRRLILPSEGMWEKVRDTGGSYEYEDEWGRTLRMPKERSFYFDFVGHPLKTVSFAEYKWPRPANSAHLQEIRAAADRYRAESGAFLCMPTIGNGFLQLGAQLYGYDDWFAMLLLERSRVEEFLDKLLELKTAYWEGTFTALEDRIDLVCESDDLGTQKGPWLDPRLWRELMKPRLASLIKSIKKMRPGTKVSFHSCGAVRDFIPDLIEIGVDVLNPVQVSAAGMNTKSLKKDFGKDLVFWGGGVDTQRVLPYGSPSEVADEAKRRIGDLAPGGGFVFAAVHNIQADVPPENILAMTETLHRHGAY